MAVTTCLAANAERHSRRTFAVAAHAYDLRADVTIDQCSRTLAAEKPDGVLAVVAGDPRELIQDPRLIFAPALLVSRTERLDELVSCLLTDPFAHVIAFRLLPSAGSKSGEATTLVW
jgi:hypothetical protein